MREEGGRIKVIVLEVLLLIATQYQMLGDGSRGEIIILHHKCSNLWEAIREEIDTYVTLHLLNRIEGSTQHTSLRTMKAAYDN
jgi:hypothetical protein